MLQFLRFGKYRDNDFPQQKEIYWTKAKWKKVVGDITGEFDNIRKLASSGEKLAQLHYDRLHGAIMRIPDIGTLSCHHVIGVASVVGILPLPLFRFVSYILT